MPKERRQTKISSSVPEHVQEPSFVSATVIYEVRIYKYSRLQ